MKRSRRQPFLTTDYMRHLHQVVIHDICQVISRQLIGRLVQHLIIQHRRINNHFTTDDVVNVYFLIWFNLETNYILLTFCNQSIDFFLRKSKRVAHSHTSRSIVLEISHFLTLGIQFFRSIESNISLASLHQNIYILLVNVATFRLTIRAMITTEAYTFVKLDTQPLERLNDIFFCSRHETARIRIFNTENQITTMLTGKQIIIQSSAYTTDMQRSSRTRSKTNSNFSV